MNNLLHFCALMILSGTYCLTESPQDRTTHPPSTETTTQPPSTAAQPAPTDATIINYNDSELIKKLEKTLLKSFGLDEKPNVDKRLVKIPPYMYQLYKQKVKLNLGEGEEVVENKRQSRAYSKAASSALLANTIRSFTHTESSEDLSHPDHKMLFRFNVSSIPDREILQGAQLRISHGLHHSLIGDLMESNTLPDSKVNRKRWSKKELIYLSRINVYDILSPSKGSRHPVHRLIDTRVVDARINSTVSLDVSPALKRWLSKPRTNYGLYVEVTPVKKESTVLKDFSHVRLRRKIIDQDFNEWNDQQPLLIVHTDDTQLSHSREKRNSPVSSFKRPHCRRYNLYVDFRKVDWDTWIVAPSGYDAFFCQGECPYPLAKHMNATNHAVIQNIIHSRYPTRVPPACCVPIKHSAISMLYLDRDRKVVLKTYQDMIVESCGCQ